MKKFLTSIAIVLSAAAHVAAHAAEVIDVASKQGAPTRTLLVLAPEPKLTVLLFIGGDGLLRLTDDGRTEHGHTFVRSINRWSTHHINAVLVDTPFGLGNAKRGHKRASGRHLTRVSEVVAHYAEKTKTPIWIFGHSMGTSSVAAFLSSGRPEINLLSGYAVAGTHRGESVPESIKLPALSIHHQRDGCEATPLEASEAIHKSRTPDTPRALVILDGGLETGHPCLARGYHGFNGVENEFIDAAARFMLKK